MRFLNKIVAFVLFLFSANFYYAQNTIPPLTYLTTEMGLSQAISYDIFQDSRGYMWFTSYDGINKFDSNKITKFTYDYNDYSSFWGNLSIGIVEDKKGNIWTGGNNYLNVYLYRENKFKHLNVKSNSVFYYYPIFATSNAVVFQKGNCFYISDSNTYKSTLFFVDKNFDYVNFSSKTFETPTSYLVFIRGKSKNDEPDSIITLRLYEFSKSDLKNPKITFFNTDYDINAIQKIDYAKYIVGTKTGLRILDLKTKKIVPFLSNIFSENITSIAKNQNTKFLISTKKSMLYELDLKNQSITTQSFFSDADRIECEKNGIQKLFIDNQENVFFTLWGKGIACYDKNNPLFKHSFTKSDILNKTIDDQYISSILYYKNNAIIVYTKSGDFYIVNDEGKRIKKITNINAYNRTNFGGDIYLHKGFEDRIFISGLDRLYELKVEEKKIIPISVSCEGLENNTINDIAIFDTSNYIVSTQKGIYVVAKDFKKGFTFDALDKNEVYTRAYIVDNKYLFVCRPYKGFDLFLYENKVLKKIKSSPINASIKDVFRRTKSEIWFASTLGIIRYNIKTNVTELDNSKDKWINTYFYSLLPDNHSNLWISHNAGITKYDYIKNKTTHYNLSHGLQGYEFNTKSFAKTENGTLFFGGTNGLNSINPNQNFVSKNKPIIQFEEIKIGDKVLDSKKDYISKNKLILANNQTTFSLKPIIINYNSCFIQHDLMYKLEGIDKSWISGQSNQTIRYSNIPAGNYTLYIKTPDNYEQKSIDILVKQVFWKSVWFWILISFLAMLIIWITQRGYYLAQVNKREAEIKKMKAIELERERIAHDMHDDLGSGLTAISYLSQSSHKDSNIKIQEKSRELIKNMSDIIWSMKSENDSITELISYIKRYANNYCEENNIEINFNVIIEDERLQINGDFRKNIYLIVKESLHNIVKHAKASLVEIQFETTNNLVLIIKDNGIGINKDKMNNGNGIKNTQKRVQQMNGLIEYTVDNGTKITICLPLPFDFK